MTSRERMKAFFKGEAIDRIPNGLGATECTGLHVLAYDKLKRVLSVDDPANRMTTFMCTAQFELPVLEALDSDMLMVGTRQCPSALWGPDAEGQWYDHELWGTKLQMPKAWHFRKREDGTVVWNDHAFCPSGGYFFDPLPPTKEEEEKLMFAPRESPSDFNPPHELPAPWLKALRRSAKWCHENMDYCLVMGEIIQDLQFSVGGVQAWWMRMIEEPEACQEFLGKAVDAGLAQLKQLNDAVGEYCDVLHIAHDMGDTRGVTVGPEIWRDVYKPHYTRLFTEWRKITNMQPCLHCCGAISDILGDLVDGGIRIFNPVQISANNMDPVALEAKHGDRLVFYGGVYDCVCLPPGTPDETVYEAVKANIKAFSRRGSYIFAGVHNLPADVTEGHLRAMLQAYNDCKVLQP